MTLHLISHPLCPYVQRAAIALAEKGVPFRRTDIDLAHKPDWFLRLSPLGKTPVLVVGETPIFESAVILEYLEETQPNPLHPVPPLDRALHRSWIEVGSAILNDVAGLYSAPDARSFAAKTATLRAKFARVEDQLGAGPWFGGARFGLVDAVFGPVFRYFDSFDRIGDFGILAGLPKVSAWRQRLADRPSVARAVAADYPQRLDRFFLARGSHLSALMRDRPHGAALEPFTTAASG
jgi:glutathione S-transferase